MNDDYGESSVVYMLTRWPHFAVRQAEDFYETAWGVLEDHLPMWICDWDNTSAKQEGKDDRSSSIVMGKFNSCYPHYDYTPIPQSLKKRSV